MAENKSHKVLISFTPWEEKGFKIELLHIWEKLGGEQPGGKMELSHDGRQEALDYITSQQTGIINIKDENNGGQSYSFGVFIIDRNYFNNRIELSFIIIPKDDLLAGKDFYIKPMSRTFSSVSKAVEQVWPGKDEKNGNPIIKNIEPDTNEGEVYQDNETGSSFLSRVCGGWKYKSVFAFSWDGLVIKGIGDDIKGDVEIVTGAAGAWQQKSTSRLKYSSLNNRSLFNPWTNDNKDDDSSISKSTTSEKDFKDCQPKFVTSSISKDSYKIHAPGYDTLEKNLKKNSEFRGYSSTVIVAQEMPKDWKIGDVVVYKRIDLNNASETEKDIKTLRCVVAANEFFFSQNGASRVGPNGYPFEWQAVLWGLDEFDVTKELQNNTNNNG